MKTKQNSYTIKSKECATLRKQVVKLMTERNILADANEELTKKLHESELSAESFEAIETKLLCDYWRNRCIAFEKKYIKGA